MKEEIINCFTWLANRVSQSTTYENWSDEFCRKDVKQAMSVFLEELKKHIDWNNLDKETINLLRFKRWGEESNLYLLPLYILPIVPVGTNLTCISGNEVIYDGNNIDTDIRFGCLAYGIVIDK